MRHASTLVCLAGCLALWLTACAAPTPYQAAGEPAAYGYSEEQLDPRTWRLQFAGNADTPREQVEDYLLYRAAEVAQGAGAANFVVLDRDVERATFYRGTIQPSYGGSLSSGTFYFGGRHRGGRYIRPYPRQAYLRPIDRYTAHATIRIFDAAPPAELGVAFDAEQVLSTLGPRIRRPEVAP